MAEKNESDLRDYGMDYDQRLSLRVHKKHMAIVDACAAYEKKSRAIFVREMIDALGKQAVKRGIMEK